VPAEIGVDQAQELAAAVSSVLDDIVAGVRIDLARREADTTPAELRRRATRCLTSAGQASA
jgi:hypothetical protein